MSVIYVCGIYYDKYLGALRNSNLSAVAACPFAISALYGFSSKTSISTLSGLISSTEGADAYYAEESKFVKACGSILEESITAFCSALLKVLCLLAILFFSFTTSKILLSSFYLTGVTDMLIFTSVLMIGSQ